MALLYITSGDSYTGARRLTITAYDKPVAEGGVVLDLSATDLIFRIESSTGDVLITKTTTDIAEIEIASPQTGATKGKAYLAIDEADTTDLSGRYLWELEATDAVGTLTLADGAIYIKGDIILNEAS